MINRGKRISTLSAAVSVVGLAVLVGLLPGVLPLLTTLGITSISLLVLVVVVCWFLLHGTLTRTREQISGGPNGSVAPEDSSRQRSTEVGRVLFFAGACCVVETGWRPVGITLSDAMFLAAFAWTCLGVLRNRPVERVPALLAAGVCIFAIGGAVSSIAAPLPGQSAYEVGRGIWVMLLWSWTASMVLRNRRDFVIVMTLWGAGAAINALGAIGQDTGLTTVAGQLHGSHRATGFSGQPTELGAAASVVLVPALTLAIRFKSKVLLLRALQWVVFGLIAATLYVSGSVTAVAGACVAVLLWMTSPAVRGATRAAILLGLAAALILSSTLGGSATSPQKRLHQVLASPGSSPEAGSGQGRLDTLKLGWRGIRQDPIIGVGLDKANLLIHNAPVAAWYGAGILGLAGLLLIFGAVLSLGWWAAVASPSDSDRLIAWALVCGFVSYLLYAMTAPLFFQQPGWFAAALVVAWAARIAERRAVVRRPSPVAEPSAALLTA